MQEITSQTGAPTMCSCVSLKYLWNLLGQIDFLFNHHRALLQRTLQIDVLDLFTEVDLLMDQGNDVIPLDVQQYCRSLLNRLP